MIRLLQIFFMSSRREEVEGWVWQFANLIENTRRYELSGIEGTGNANLKIKSWKRLF
jgi:hypothetical protein